MSWKLDQVTIRRRGRTHLAPLDLEIRPGSLTAIVGGDGAGKTTLLRVLAGALRLSGGRVHAPPRERIGYVAAGSAIHLDLTVMENLRFAGAAYHVRGAEERRTAVLAATGLTAARHRLGGQLSGGMRQKLGFACAMLHEPDLLVMDEPTTGLDPVSRAELWRLVSTTVASGTAAVFATTYVDEAARADQVLVLDQGRTLAVGAPEALCRAVPGHVVELDAPVEGLPSWRRGRVRHAWVASGAPPTGATPLTPDLEDAVIVAALDVAATEVPV